jgi:hypothetical protein
MTSNAIRQIDENLPTLDDVLKGLSAPPYTLDALRRYMAQNKCLELLEFTEEARGYEESYYSACIQLGCFSSSSSDRPESWLLLSLWQRLLSLYVTPGALREISILSRDEIDLLTQPKPATPPSPILVIPIMNQARDLIENSVFIPFLYNCACGVLE